MHRNWNRTKTNNNNNNVKTALEIYLFDCLLCVCVCAYASLWSALLCFAFVYVRHYYSIIINKCMCLKAILVFLSEREHKKMIKTEKRLLVVISIFFFVQKCILFNSSSTSISL